VSLETATYLDALVTSNPPGSDQLSTADDHIRLLKACLQRTFPNIDAAVSATPAQLKAAALGETSVSFAQSASFAISANYAASAGAAVSAQFATSATNATSAKFATSATNATSAKFATSATNATSAVFATSATNATSARFATSAAAATSAQFALSANRAGSAVGAQSAQFATSATRATSASYADSAGYASNVETKYKATGEDVISSTTYQDDDELAGFTLVGNSNYAIEAFLPFHHGGGDLKINLDFSQVPSMGDLMYHAAGADGAGSAYYDGTSFSASSDLAILGVTSGANGGGVLVTASFRSNSAGGTLTLQWAQRVSDTDATQIRQGAWMRVTRID